MSLDVEVRDLRLRYCDGPEALRGISFRLEAGTICGLLGRNGAGKTSLLAVLASLRRPTSGQVLVGGVDPFENAEVMAQIGLIGEGGAKVHKVHDVLGLAQTLRPRWDHDYARKLLDRFEVPVRQAIGKLSRGKRAALAVVCGLAARTPLTMFDEAHLGMDAPSRYAFYDELLRDVMAHPRTVILSTHHIDEVAGLLGEVLIVDRGRLVVQADTDELRGRGTEVVGPAAVVDDFVAGMTTLSQRELGRTKAAVVYGDLGDDQLRRAREQGLDLGPIPLQDLFVHLTNDLSDHEEEAR